LTALQHKCCIAAYVTCFRTSFDCCGRGRKGLPKV